MERKLRGFSFFSGVGLSTVGYKRAGLDVVGCCEIDSKQLEVYRQNHKPSYVIRDIKEALSEDFDFLYGLDFFDGSPPCTNFSVLNSHRVSLSMTERVAREGGVSQVLEELLLVYLKCVYKYKPRFFSLENVKSLVEVKKNKELLDGYIKESKVEDDYLLYPIILNSSDYGAYTSRNRFFLIGIRKGELESSFIGEASAYLRDSRAPRRALRDMKGGVSYVPYTVNEEKPQSTYNRHRLLLSSGKFKTHETREVCLVDTDKPLPTISTKPCVFLHPQKLGLQISLETLIEATQLDPDYFRGFSDSRARYGIGMGVPPALTATIGGLVNKLLTFY